jgi:hypothetical protein
MAPILTNPFEAVNVMEVNGTNGTNKTLMFLVMGYIKINLFRAIPIVICLDLASPGR